MKNVKRKIVMAVSVLATVVVLYLVFFRSELLYSYYEYDVNIPCSLYPNDPLCYDPERVASMEHNQLMVNIATVLLYLIALVMAYRFYKSRPKDHWIKKLIPWDDEEKGDERD